MNSRYTVVNAKTQPMYSSCANSPEKDSPCKSFENFLLSLTEKEKKCLMSHEKGSASC